MGLLDRLFGISPRPVTPPETTPPAPAKNGVPAAAKGTASAATNNATHNAASALTSVDDELWQLLNGKADSLGADWGRLIRNYKPVLPSTCANMENGRLPQQRMLLENVIFRDLAAKRNLSQRGLTLDQACPFDRADWTQDEWYSTKYIAFEYMRKRTDRDEPASSDPGGAQDAQRGDSATLVPCNANMSVRVNPQQYHPYLHRIGKPSPEVLQSIAQHGLRASLATGVLGQGEGVYALTADEGALPDAGVFCVFATRHPCVLKDRVALFPLSSGRFVKAERMMFVRLDNEGRVEMLSPQMEPLGTASLTPDGGLDLTRLQRKRLATTARD